MVIVRPVPADRLASKEEFVESWGMMEVVRVVPPDTEVIIL
jgi:hypothetical protein